MQAGDLVRRRNPKLKHFLLEYSKQINYEPYENEGCKNLTIMFASLKSTKFFLCLLRVCKKPAYCMQVKLKIANFIVLRIVFGTFVQSSNKKAARLELSCFSGVLVGELLVQRNNAMARFFLSVSEYYRLKVETDAFPYTLWVLFCVSFQNSLATTNYRPQRLI